MSRNPKSRLISASARPRQDAGPVEVPSYAPPQFPLNIDAQTKLQVLSNNPAEIRSLKKLINDALAVSTGAATDAAERDFQMASDERKRRERRQRQGLEVDDDELERQRQAEERRMATIEFTARMEEQIRKLVDVEAELEARESALKLGGSDAITESRNAQREIQNATENADAEPVSLHPQLKGMMPIFEEKLAAGKEEWSSKSKLSR